MLFATADDNARRIADDDDRWLNTRVLVEGASFDASAVDSSNRMAPIPESGIAGDGAEFRFTVG
ncbi:hypothetical protein [Glutamicibacter halophytocola]|uniref:hypothetical protein n=1 Tax=Glutamicibacter halophytocola TaxID=1933880 RepID=UPI0015C55E86|nr:hypothetical protein [Glutamicibacter halophytocola]NQD42395.1 hypothetical protein [Glutamicibacter halophytocola]